MRGRYYVRGTVGPEGVTMTDKWAKPLWLLRLIDVRDGIREGFPICCVIRFATDRRYWNQAARRGIKYPTSEWAHVPCGWLHKADVLGLTCCQDLTVHQH